MKKIKNLRGARQSSAPKKEDGTLDKEAMKIKFMASPHLAWTPFAIGIGLDPVRSRSNYPTKDWIEEKKISLMGAMYESKLELQAKIFGKLGKIIEDQFVSALNKYQRMDEILIQKLSSLTEDTSASDFKKLIESMKILEDFKKDFLNNLFSGVVSLPALEAPKEFIATDEGLAFSVMTPEGVKTDKEMMDLLTSYYDKPWSESPHNSSIELYPDLID